MHIRIVIARYNENIEWSNEFNNIIIYNKGEKLKKNYNKEIILNNIGREQHTYYTHIYNNYDNLDDYTIFLQGNPFDHSPNIINTLKNYLNTKDLNIEFEYISELCIVNNIKGNYKRTFSETLNLPYFYKKIFNQTIDLDSEYLFGTGSQFIVSKNYILKHNKSFYKNLLNMFETEPHEKLAHVLERFTPLIVFY